MANETELKARMESIEETRKITNAMYLISSSKLRKARQNYQNVSPYFNRMRDTISRVVPVSYTHLDVYKRQRCDSSLIRYVGAYIAQRKALAPEEVFRTTAANARRVFGL